MKLAAVAFATVVFGFLGSSTAHATMIGDTVLFQGCALVPLFPTDCTGLPFFTEQTTVVTADATDLFTFGTMITNVQASSIIVTLQLGQGTGAFFNGTLVRGIDWVGMPAILITGFTLTDNTMGLSPAEVNVFENGHAIAINVGVASLTAGSATINLFPSVPDQQAVPEPTTLLLLGTGLAGAGARRWRKRRAS